MVEVHFIMVGIHLPAAEVRFSAGEPHFIQVEIHLFRVESNMGMPEIHVQGAEAAPCAGQWNSRRTQFRLAGQCLIRSRMKGGNKAKPKQRRPK